MKALLMTTLVSIALSSAAHAAQPVSGKYPGVMASGQSCAVAVDLYAPNYDSYFSGRITVGGRTHSLWRGDETGSRHTDCKLSDGEKSKRGLNAANIFYSEGKGIGDFNPGYESATLTYDPTGKLIQADITTYNGGIFACLKYEHNSIDQSMSVSCRIP